MSDGAERSAQTAVTHDRADGSAPAGPGQGHLPGAPVIAAADAAIDGPPLGREADPDRVRADRELVNALAACGFAGPGYDNFEDRLAKYGLAVLCAWMR